MEILIASYVKDQFVRPYVGDILAAILVYCFIRSFFNVSVTKAALDALTFSVVIEMLQYVNFAKWIGLDGSGIAGTALGHAFDWKDLLMYAMGILFVLAVEKFVPGRRTFSKPTEEG